MSTQDFQKILPQTLEIQEVFSLFASDDINWKKLYCYYFNALPNKNLVYDLNGNRVIKWIESEQAYHITRKHSTTKYRRHRQGYKEVVYVLDNQCMILINNTNCVEVLYSNNLKEAEILTNSILKFRAKATGSHIHIVVNDSNGLSLKSLKIKKLNCTIKKNYNDDLASLHERMVETFRKKNTSGLSLFYGIPGTGKSSYIRYLITLISKKIIFLPPRIAGNMDNPEIISLLIENPNTIIVIEDAEDLLVSRETENNSAISMLLNLTDGLLGASLGIQFICTFNTHLNNIDKALLRKGRLSALYEFKALSEIKSQELLIDLGKNNFKVTHPMTLAEIFYATQAEFEYERKPDPIGFETKMALN